MNFAKPRTGDHRYGIFRIHRRAAEAILDLADEVSPWNERSLIDALRRQARHQESTRWDTIEFKWTISFGLGAPA